MIGRIGPFSNGSGEEEEEEAASSTSRSPLKPGASRESPDRLVKHDKLLRHKDGDSWTDQCVVTHTHLILLEYFIT